MIDNVTIKPGVSVEGDDILMKNLEYETKISINHRIKNFVLEFASINTREFSKIIYKYRLKGFDKGWNYSSSKSRFVNYTGLPSGNYTFELFASGGDDIWVPMENQFEIKVLPPFWNSIPGYIFYALVLLGALFMQRRSALKAINFKHEELILENTRAQEIRGYEDKMQFITNISHELRTPLTLISTPLEQAASWSEAPKYVKESITTARNNADKLRRLIDQILDIRKLESGNLFLNEGKVDLDLFLSEISSQFIDIAKKNNISLNCESKTFSSVVLDKFKLEQVLINLIYNAIKFTPPDGEILLSSSLKGKTLYIKISNTGSYIPPSAIEEIFKPFYQIEKSESGTGLGLTISRSMVELHGGTLVAESFEKTGESEAKTVFILEIPQKEEIEVNKLMVENEIEEQDDKIFKSSILIVDDNIELRHILRDEFAKEYTVYEAGNGKEGLKAVKKENPSIILSDLMMPEMDGLEFCKRLKSNLSTSNIPIIMLTAKGTQQSKLEGLEAMVDDYIAKPFSLIELKLKIRNTLKLREMLLNKIENQIALKPAELHFDSRDEKLIKSIISIVEKNIEDCDFTVETLCLEIAISRPSLYRKVKELTGMSIQLFLLDIKLKRAAQLLLTKSFSVSEVMYKTGFSSPSYFNKAFKTKFNINPKNYKSL
ncbi:MAG: response regulator [Flavobacterium sp.]|nr:MAG: response regulator [Flavobacterium sp.]